MKLIMKTPSSWWRSRWREALPSGNGIAGAAVYGSVHEETVMLTHTNLWRGGLSPELPDVSDALPLARSLLLNGEAEKADRLLSDELKKRGYEPKMAWPLPLGDLIIKQQTNSAFKQYRRCLDMSTGEISVQWLDGETTFKRRLFVSRTDDMIVGILEANGRLPIEALLHMELHDTRDVRRPGIEFPDAVEVWSSGEMLYYAARNDDGSDFGAVVRVIAEQGQLEAADGKLRVSDTQKVLIGIKLFVKEKRQVAWTKLSTALMHLNEGYDVLLTRHQEVHSTLFKAMRLDLNAPSRETSNEELLLDAYEGEASLELTEKLWAYGRYLLLSSSSPDSQPCHLYGLWCGEYEGMWAFNMVNENLQMIYWQALSGNMPELLEAVFGYMERHMDDFRRNARQLFGCRGIYIPAPTAPGSGLIKHVTPHILHWTGGAGWIAQHYYDYYLHTQDERFLQERALPFLYEVALFYEDYFILDEKGSYLSCPSNSPENTPGNYWNGQGMGAHMETTINATMDFAIAKEVLSNLIEGSQIVNRYAEHIEHWRAMLNRIPPYQLNVDGSVREWMHPYFEDNDHHRHQSHLYPLFPGIEITRGREPDLFHAFVAALRKRLVIGMNQQTGWSLAHMSNIYSRIGEGDAALECLDMLSRSSVMNNLFTTHNDWRRMGIGVDMEWAPFQIDANMGWTAAVHEMLVFSLPGTIYVLPALPQRWAKGSAGPFLARGGVQVTINWDLTEDILQVKLLSLHKDQEVELIAPVQLKDSWGAMHQVKLVKGKEHIEVF